MHGKKFRVYGISQNPNTKDYIIVLQDRFCHKCGKEYFFGWCKPCQINDFKKNFTNWTSGNEKIDGFIQEMQLKIYSPWDVIFEWVTYSQFDDIKELICKEGFASAIWKNGPLTYDEDNEKYMRKSTNKKVILECLHNSQNNINEFLDKV